MSVSSDVTAFFSGIVFMIMGVAIIIISFAAPQAYSEYIFLLGIVFLSAGVLSWISLLGEKPL